MPPLCKFSQMIRERIHIFHWNGNDTYYKFFRRWIHVTDEHKDDRESLSRRRFMKNTGMVAGGVVGGSLLGGLLTNQFRTTDEPATEEMKQDFQDTRMFFSRKSDFAILSDATERIYPKDDNGPGAIELGVPYFIDKQLAGSWGTNAKAYMKDPFWQNDDVNDYEHQDTKQDKSGPNTSQKVSSPTPRYQTRMNRGELFLHGLRTMEDVSQKEFGDSFINLDNAQQEEVLTMFENGEIEMNAVAGVTFFNLLLQMTIEGAFADPVYGGNKNMLGWKMKEFPGPRISYAEQIEPDEFIALEQKSLRTYQTGGM